MAKVLIDPITRIEGHLSLEIDVQNGKIVDAKSIGDMYRGFEKILRGRNPVDANQITQRICGVCPVSHGLASSQCLDDAFGIKPNKTGRILRNLTLAANYLQSHIIHFYHLSALDYVDIKALLGYKGSDAKMLHLKGWVNDELKTKKGRVDAMTSAGPFLPRYEGKNFYIENQEANINGIANYVKALDIRIKAHQMVTLFGGRMPHAISLVPGGMTQIPTKDKIKQYKKLLKEVEAFVNNEYTNDILAVAKTYSNDKMGNYFKIGAFTKMLSYGVFNLDDTDDSKQMFNQGISHVKTPGNFDAKHITEMVGKSKYSSGSNLHPFDGQTDADAHKAGAYTWLKAPRYKGEAMEVGPLARVVVSYLKGNKAVQDQVDGLLKMVGGKIEDVFSVLGRHATRLIEAKMICQEAYKWLDELEPNSKPRNSYVIPQEGKGMGLTEAPRGALGHWIQIKGQKIDNYQAVVPTTWYCGPTDEKGVRGPVEEMLIGTPIADINNPIEAARVVRSTDPCLACAVHVVEGDKKIGEFRVC